MLGLIVLLQMLIILRYFGRMGLVVIGFSVLALTFVYAWISTHSLKRDYITLNWTEMPWLYDSIARMAGKAGIGMPNVYLLDDYIPNAYSFRNSIVLSMGLFEVLDRDGILGVVAHELGHIKNNDTLLFPVVVYARYLMMLLMALGVLFSHSLPIQILSITLYIMYEADRVRFFKEREFKADEAAVRLLDRPMSLKDALEELKYYEDLRAHVKESALPGIEPSIERKQRKSRSTGIGIMDTHPTYDERILRIMIEVEGLSMRSLLK